jgi:hypothetical protein
MLKAISIYSSRLLLYPHPTLVFGLLSTITSYSQSNPSTGSNMAGGGVGLASPVALDRIEAPVTMKAYLMCVFAAFAGIFFGFDTGYISGTLAMSYFIYEFTRLPYPAADASTATVNAFVIPAWRQSLIVYPVC